MWLYIRLFVSALGLILVLRQQFAVYEQGRPAPGVRSANRQFWSVLARRWPR